MELISAPAVHTRRRSRWAPSSVDASIRRALVATRYSPHEMAVLHEGEAVGIVRGDPRGQWADYTPMRHGMWCTVTGYNDLRTALSQGHGCRMYFRQEVPSWTLDGAWADCWPVVGTGKVGAGGGGTYTGTANTARQLDNTSPGALWWPATPGASETAYLVGWSLSNSTNLGRQVILYDRVLTYESVGISNTITNFTNTLAAQRYISTGDPGLMVSPTIQTATGATASNITSLVFTDDQGNTGVSQVSSFTQAIIASGTAPSSTAGAEVAAPSSASRAVTPWLNLGGTVQGVRKLESVTCSAANTGTLCYALIRPLATLSVHGGSMTAIVDLTKAMFTLTKAFSTACLAMLMIQNGSNGGAFQGEVSWAFK